MLRPLHLSGLAIALCAAAPALAQSAPQPVAFTASTSIPLPDGRWDYASWDAAHGRVLVAHGGDVLVIDPSGAGTVHTIGTIAGAHAALAIPGTNTVLVTSGHDGSARILDESSGAELAHIALAPDADSATLSPDGRTAFVMSGDPGVVSVIDLATRKVTRTITLKPGLEAPVLASPSLLAISNEQRGEIELANPATGKASGTIALPGCTGPSGLAYAPGPGLALSVCGNGVAALVDLARRRLVALVPIGQGPDTAIWQAARHRFLVPCGRSGTLSIITLDGAGAHAEPAVSTEPGARTATLDPVSGRVYLPTARFLPAAAERHPPLVPGSVHLLVLAPAP